MTTLYFIFLAGLFTLAVWRLRFFSVRGLPKSFVVSAFLLKVFAGIGLTWVYTFYYTDTQNADIYKYFNDGLILKNCALQNPSCFLKLFFEIVPASECGLSASGMKYWDIPFTTGFYNDNRLLIKINCLMAFVSFNNVFIHALMASFMGFCSLMLLVKTAELMMLQKSKWYAIMLLLFPSLLAWTSVVIKETVLVFVLGIFLYSAASCCLNRNKTLKLVIALLSFVALTYIKVYVALCLLPCLIAFAWARKDIEVQKVALKYAIVLLLGFVFLAAADNYLLKHKLWIRLAYKQYGMVKLAEYENAQSAISIPALSLSEKEKHTFFKAAAGGFGNALLRPNLLDRGNPLVSAAGIENFLLLMILFAKLSWLTLTKPQKPNQLFFIITCCVLLLTVTGITTPVLGSLVRFKVPYYCFVLML